MLNTNKNQQTAKLQPGKYKLTISDVAVVPHIQGGEMLYAQLKSNKVSITLPICKSIDN